MDCIGRISKDGQVIADNIALFINLTAPPPTTEETEKMARLFYLSIKHTGAQWGAISFRNHHWLLRPHYHYTRLVRWARNPCEVRGHGDIWPQDVVDDEAWTSCGGEATAVQYNAL